MNLSIRVEKSYQGLKLLNMDVNVHTQIPYSQYGKEITGIDKGITNDILAMEIRQALYHLGEITGEITTDDLLDNPPAVGQVFSGSSACPPKEGIGK